MILKKEKMRTTQDNKTFFIDLMKLKTTFYWKGHELQLMGDHIEVLTQEALNELRSQTSEDFHKHIVIFEPTL
jgi:hypothetical protein